MLNNIIARIKFIFKKPEWYDTAKSELVLYFDSEASPDLPEKDIDICIKQILKIIFEIKLANLPLSNNTIIYITENLLKEKTLIHTDASDSPDSNKAYLNNMNNTELLIFLHERCGLQFCRFCRGFMSSPRDPDVCGWRGKNEQCLHGFSDWLRDKNPEGEMDARIE